MRFSELDSWRGLMAIAVIVLHFVPAKEMTGFYSAYLAVDFFFMLSGFVLTHSYGDRLGKGIVTPGGFFKARIVRLLPVHLTVIVLIVAFNIWAAASGMATFWAGDPELSFSVYGALLLAWDAALLNNIILPPGYQGWGINGVSWSISIELWIGLVLLLVITRRGRLPICFATLAAASCYIIVLVSAWHLHGVKTEILYANHGILRGIAGFMLGFISYRLWEATRPFLASMRVLPASLAEGLIVVAVGLLFARPEDRVLDFALIVIGPALLIIYAAGRGLVSRLLRLWPFQVLGALSFSIYMVHQPIQRVLTTLGFHDDAPRFVAATLVTATIMWCCVERRFEPLAHIFGKVTRKAVTSP